VRFAVVLANLLLLAGSLPAQHAATVRVGAKVDVEGGILGEMVAQLVRAAGARADARQLGNTGIVWQALRAGDIDVYPEYTGTLLREIFAGRGLADEAALRQALAEHGIRMSRPLGFNNTYALGMKDADAERLGIRAISDLRRHPDLRIGFTNEFLGGADGWPRLRQLYRLPQRDVRGLDHSLAYQALRTGAIDVTDLYSTDPKIRTLGLRVLQDDRKSFPEYQAVLLCRADFERRAPEALAAMLRLEGRITEADMVTLNARVEEDREPAARVAADFLAQTFALVAEVRQDSVIERLLRHAGEHLLLVGLSLGAAGLAAVPLGVVAARYPRFGQLILGGVGMIQTIPSLALLVFLIPLLSTGGKPAIAALFLYSLLPIVRNTYLGLRDIPPALIESADALGLSPLARLRLVEWPLAARSVLAGIKTAAVINVGTATIGGLIGAGGFGQPIVTGLQLNDVGLVIWQGALPAAALALLVQGFFELVERAVVPKGLRLAKA
jgi:osmoprotectant transport system permease protein